MNLLMAVQVYKGKVSVAIFSSRHPWFAVVQLRLLLVEEALPTDRASVILVLGDLLPTGCQVLGFRRIPCDPVVLQTCIIG